MIIIISTTTHNGRTNITSENTVNHLIAFVTLLVLGLFEMLPILIFSSIYQLHFLALFSLQQRVETHRCSTHIAPGVLNIDAVNIP